VAKKAACGPPYPIGTPKRCVEPSATSAPISPGERRRVRARRSVATTRSAPAAWALAARPARSRTTPSVAGYCTRTPKSLWPAKSTDSTGPTWTWIPRAADFVRTSAIVCGWQSSATKKPSRPGFATARHRVIASPAAVASSRRDALARGRPVRSATIVWKLRRASRRPCEISGW
jgi:hypothetical protein